MLCKVYMRKDCVYEGAEMWWLESPKQMERGMCVRLVCSILGEVRRPWVVLALRGEGDSDGDSQVRLARVCCLVCVVLGVSCASVVVCVVLFVLRIKLASEICRTRVWCVGSWCVCHCGARYYERQPANKLVVFDLNYPYYYLSVFQSHRNIISLLATGCQDNLTVEE